MDTRKQSLQLGIGGSWTATEMADSFSEIDFLYNLRLYLNSIEDAELYWDELSDFFPPFRMAKPHGHPHPMFMHHGLLIHQPGALRQYSRLYFPKDVLRVARIDFASPGAKVFLGIAEILEQVRLFIQFLIELPNTREKQELSNGARRIQNARDFVKLRVESARGNAEIEQIENEGLAELVDDSTRTLLKLVEEEKITSAIMLEDEPDDTE